jgi:GntR family transcriptional regulator
LPQEPRHIDPYAVVPKYHQLCEIVRQKIENGVWQPHQSIPSERELEALYGISRTTVRQALDLLVSQGLLYRRHGSGTFVARPKQQHSLHLLTGFSDEMRTRGLQPGQRVLSLGFVEPTARIRSQLELAAEICQVLRIERLRLDGGEPVSIDTAYLPLSAVQSVTVADLEASGSLYAILASRFNLIPAEADETLEATAADAREASLLQVREGSPLLLIERTTWASNQRPMEFAKMLCRADRYKFYMHITRSAALG